MALCTSCGFPRTPGKYICGACGTFSAVEAGAGIRGVRTADVIPFSEVTGASVERLKCGGQRQWDEAWGGGMVPATQVLFAGTAGAGKSTLLSQIADSYLEVYPDKWALYLSAESDSAELKVSLSRLGLRHMDRILGLRTFGAGGEIDEDVFKRYPPIIVIVDSLSALTKDLRAQVAVAARHKAYAVRWRHVSFCVVHMVKGGDASGLEALKHMPDAVAGIDHPEDRDPARFRRGVGPNGGSFRKLQVLKHRHGPTNKDYFYEMTSTGLIEVPPDPVKETRDGQELGELPVRDTNTLAGATLHARQLEQELKETTAQLTREIKKAKQHAVQLAVAEPEGTPVEVDDEDDELAEVLDPPPRTPAKRTPPPDTITHPDTGQVLVRRGLRVMRPDESTPEEPSR